MRIAKLIGATRSPAFLVSVLTLLLAGCGPKFDPPSELHSLRVLAVQKDVPYAQPGDTVNLQMLWHDASPLAPRPVQVAWSAPCINPAGDLYYGCFADPALFSGMVTLDQDTVSFVMPTNIISMRPEVAQSNNARYGLAYLFFAVCAGELSFLSNGAVGSFPIGCKDAAGTLLGSDDFVAGYTSVYSFESFSNHNPVMTGLSIDGVAFAAPAEPGGGAGDVGACVGEACRAQAGSTLAADFDCALPGQAARCIPTCADDGDSACPAHRLLPLIDKQDPNNQDQDDVSAQLLGRNVGEQMWINYYTDAGGFKSAVRLLNDATSGWNDNFGTEFYAPQAPGPFRIWAVAHDNRGGVAWSGLTLKAQ